MPISQRARDLTDKIYKWYGSDSGYLFGIRPQDRPGVKAVVQCVLDQVEGVEEEEKD